MAGSNGRQAAQGRLRMDDAGARFRGRKDRGRIPINPCERGGQTLPADRTDRLWTKSDLARLLSIASPEMELTVLLALGTGQRQGDLLRLRWSDYDGKHIRLRQSKTGQAVVVRIGGLLKARLDASQRRGPMVLTNTRGRPWTSDGFRTSWAKLCKRADIDNLTFHDLRGSAVTRLALAGATPQEIAGVTGHSLARREHDPRQALSRRPGVARRERNPQASAEGKENKNCKPGVNGVEIRSDNSV